MLYKKIHFFDKGVFNPYRMSNARLRVNKAIKEGKIFFTEDEDWEIRYDNSYPNIFFDKNINKYRCYYSTFTEDDESEKYSLEDRKKLQYKPTAKRIVSLCYAESEDGINWTKPSLGITNFRGSKKNNIIGHYLHGTTVLLDEKEVDPDKRYKMFTKIDYGNGIHFTAVLYSKDGLNFGNYVVTPNFNPRADTHNHIIYDESIERYVLVTRTWRDSLRIPCISTSEDFVNWKQPQEILSLCDYDSQIYSMPIFKEGDYILGLASVFHEGDQMDEDYDTVDLALTYSYRYGGWHYIDNNNYFIDRGEGKYGDGDFDCGCIYSSQPVKVGNRTYFYYMGGNGQHTNFRETSLSRAYIENDRYAYWENKRTDYESILYTNAFTFLDEEVYLDADIEEQGYIKVELFSKKNEKLDIKTHLERIENRYKLVFDGPIPRTATHLKIFFKKAKLYSIEGNLDISRVESGNALLRN